MADEYNFSQIMESCHWSNNPCYNRMNNLFFVVILYLRKFIILHNNSEKIQSKPSFMQSCVGNREARKLLGLPIKINYITLNIIENFIINMWKKKYNYATRDLSYFLDTITNYSIILDDSKIDIDIDPMKSKISGIIKSHAHIFIIRIGVIIWYIEQEINMLLKLNRTTCKPLLILSRNISNILNQFWKSVIFGTIAHSISILNCLNTLNLNPHLQNRINEIVPILEEYSLNISITAPEILLGNLGVPKHSWNKMISLFKKKNYTKLNKLIASLNLWITGSNRVEIEKLINAQKEENQLGCMMGLFNVEPEKWQKTLFKINNIEPFSNPNYLEISIS